MANLEKPENPPLEAPKMTPEQAEAWGTIMDRAHPIIREYFSHAERVNEQNRVAARPIYWIAGGIVAATAGAALWAIVSNSENQLARELLLPLLSFAGGLGIGRSVAPSK